MFKNWEILRIGILGNFPNFGMRKKTLIQYKERKGTHKLQQIITSNTFDTVHSLTFLHYNLAATACIIHYSFYFFKSVLIFYIYKWPPTHSVTRSLAPSNRETLPYTEIKIFAYLLAYTTLHFLQVFLSEV